MPLASPLSRFRRKRAAAPPPAPFVVGVARSGTTLLRLMLDSHPQLTIPPETHFIPRVIRAFDGEPGEHERALRAITEHRRWPDFRLDADELAERFRAPERLDATLALRAFYGLWAERQGKPRWGDKSPSYVRKMRRIQRTLPEARFVHLIRDGRDVALSLVDVHFGPSDLADAAAKWTEEIAGARKAGARVEHYMEVRYEDLVRDPEAALRKVCAFVELDFDAAMLDYHHDAAERMAVIARDFERKHRPDVPAEVRARQHRRVSKPPSAERVERWRDEMSAEQLAAFEQVAGETLAALGYSRGSR